MTTAPIALFVYNRPEHTRRTVEALQKNALAQESDLIVFSDAPKSQSQTEAVREVRQYIHRIGGFKSIVIVERETNLGLARSIIDGVSRVVDAQGRIIVLEDDLVTSPYFLDFMNRALDAYQDDEKVMHISGYMFPIDQTDLPETFFLRTASCWGWATWSRAWQHFEKNPGLLPGEFDASAIRRFDMDGANSFWAQVEQNAQGLIDTWAVFWYASVFKKNGLCLHPRVSMVNNIGHDDSGEHCRQTDVFATTLASKPVSGFEADIAESALAHARTREFFLAPGAPETSRSTFRRLLSAIRRRLP
ncbi:MAG: glycosyltransferase [Nitrosomonadales bacterium]|nr:glycosyltransferase [Nitrosomonadales bacterium]